MNLVLIALWWLGSRNSEITVKHGSLHLTKAPPASANKEEGEMTGGLAALQYRWERRRSSDGSIPKGALLKALAQSKELPILKGGVDDDAGIWRWDWLGPRNIGGRTRTILFAGGQTVWTGGVSGGIWKSTDMTGSWIGVNDFLPSLQVTSMARDAWTPNILYAATGEGFAGRSTKNLNGAGVFRSTDGGQTWSQLQATQDWVAVTRVVADPQLTGILFAAVSDDPASNGIWRSVDHGDTWVRVLSTTADAKDIKIGRTTTSYVLVGTATGAYLSRSNGTAGTFVNLLGANKLPSNAGRCEMAFGKSTAGFETLWASIGRNKGEIWRSIDEGATWQRRSTGIEYLSTQADYGNSIWASPDDANLVVVGGIFPWRSTDAGATLTRIATGIPEISCHPDIHAIVEAPGYGPGNREVYFATDGGIMKAFDITTVSTSGGWGIRNAGLGITQFYKGTTRSDGSAMLGGTQDNSTPIFLRPTGIDWGWSPVLTDGGWCVIDDFHPKIWVTSQYLVINRSDDGNVSYTNKSAGITDSDDPSACLFIAPFIGVNVGQAGEKLFAGGRSLWQSTDGGDHWAQIINPAGSLVSAIARDEGSDSTIFGTRSGSIVRIPPIGNLEIIHSNSGRTVTDLVVVGPGQYYATFGGFEPNQLQFTNDYGQNWVPLNGSAGFQLPLVHVECMAVHPQNPDWLYVGTDLGVFASEDHGQTWGRTPISGSWQHDGPVNTEVHDLLWHSGNTLVAFTHGRGVFESRILSIVYVDKWSTSSIEDGSLANPYKTINRAEDNSGPGVIYSIKSGVYVEARKVHSRRSKYVSRDGPVQIR